VNGVISRVGNEADADFLAIDIRNCKVLRIKNDNVMILFTWVSHREPQNLLGRFARKGWVHYLLVCLLSFLKEINVVRGNFGLTRFACFFDKSKRKILYFISFLVFYLFTR